MNNGAANSTVESLNEVEQYLGFIEQARRAAAQRAPDYAHLRYFCLFVGYPKSGHSIVGSMLDAHPNMVIAQELDALRCLSAGMDRQLLFHFLAENARRFSEQGRRWNDHAYAVPGQWQGRYGRMEVIGDKKGGRSSVHLLQQPGALDTLRQVVGLPLRLVHVVRNPYDTIAALSRDLQVGLPQAAQMFFQMAASVAALKGRVGQDEMIDLRHEDLIADPRQTLSRLCGFLGQPAPADYLDACAGIVFASPHQSRREAQWPEGLREDIQAAMRQFPFLAGYSYEQ